MHDDKIDHKIGRDFRMNHPGMLHLHSGMEHLNNVDVEVNIYHDDIYHCCYRITLV